MNFEEKYVDGWLLLTKTQVMLAQSVKDFLYTKQYKGCMDQREKITGSKTYELQMLSVAETASLQVLKQVATNILFYRPEGEENDIRLALCSNMYLAQLRHFAAVFEAVKEGKELTEELLRGEKDLNTIAAENNIQPNLLRNWKKEFLDKASVVFDDTREENLKEKLASERREKAEYAKKVGQLTMQVDWLKKKSEETLGPDYESKFSPKPFED